MPTSTSECNAQGLAEMKSGNIDQALCQAVVRDALEGLRKFGAGDRDRTGDIQLGKLAFYR
jgi:hypothetical protein